MIQLCHIIFGFFHEIPFYIFADNISLSFFLSLFALFVSASTKLNISVSNNKLYITSCGSQLQSLMGYKAYVDDAEIFTTGMFAGFPCYNGDLFLDNLSGFLSAYTSRPFHLRFDFYTDIGFTAGVVSHLDLYYDGTNFSTLGGSSNVLFLPGIEASRLYKFGSVTCTIHCEDRLWEPTSDGDAQDLYLNSDGTSINPDIYIRDVVDKAYGTFNIYKSFLDQLDTLKTTNVISDYVAVPYDWRMSLDSILSGGATSTRSNIIGSDDLNISYIHSLDSGDEPYILSALERLASTSPNGKVTIVAHSNGGLVAKALLKKLADTNNPLLAQVDKLVLVAVPQLGTPEAIGALLHGYDQGILFALSENVARGLGDNAPGAYNLLPSANYFTYVDTPPVTIDGVTLPQWNSRYGSIIHSQDRFHYFLTDTFDRVLPTSTNTDTPSSIHDAMLASAEAVHTALDNWTAPHTMQVFEIAGWGVPTTVSAFNYHSNYDDIVTAVPEPKFTIDGDGVVVTPSALWSNSVGDVKYWVNLRDYNKDNPFSTLNGRLPFDHKSILEVPQLREVIQNIITSSPQTLLPQYISTSAPVAGATDSRLIYALHSKQKVSLNLYDNLGNHTGISTTTGKTEENIPGTYFTSTGGTSYVFTPISTDTATSTHIFITLYPQGAPTPTDIQPHAVTGNIATSTFTLSVDEMQGDTAFATTTFKDIPIDTNTTVSIDIVGGVSTFSPLFLDTNNDGVADIIVAPIINGIATIPPPIATSTQDTASTSIPSATENVVATSNQSNGPIVGGGSILVPIVSSLPASIIATSTTFIESTSTTVSENSVISFVPKIKKIPAKILTKEKTVRELAEDKKTPDKSFTADKYVNANLLARANATPVLSKTMEIVLGALFVALVAVIIYLL